MPGRHFALRPAMRAAVLQALGAGSTYRDAAQAAGIPWRTWCDWTRVVRDGRCSDPDVESLVTEARSTYAKATNAITAQVRLASAKDWRAAAFLLDHRRGNPKARHDTRRARFEAEIAKHRAEGTHVENVRNVGEMSDDELRAEAQRLAADIDGTRH